MVSCMLGLLRHNRAAILCAHGGNNRDHTQPLVDGSWEPPLNLRIFGAGTGVVPCPAKLPLGQVLLPGGTEGGGHVGRVVVV